ncbi:MAG TPA: energy transducer TonB [Bryobacteraceae bacterium]
MTVMDEFDVLLDDVLRTIANPELPERVRVRTRVYVQEMVGQPTSQNRDVGHPIPGRSAVVFSPALFEQRMNPKRDAKSTAIALLLHAAAILLVFWLTAMHVQFAAPINKALITALTPPPPMALAKDRMGGGGGQRGPTPVTKGQLPKFADQPITPPKAPPMVEPKIRMPDPTIEVQKDLKMANDNLPNFGMPNSPLLGNSMGNGSGSGLGSGNGSGMGPGSGGNYGGGLRRIGGGVSSPVVIYQVEPEFSEEARKAKFMGVVVVNLIVDSKGMPQNVHVLRGVGMGLDQKAVEAVRQYRFKPAIAEGKPVPVELNVQVDFQIF